MPGEKGPVFHGIGKATGLVFGDIGPGPVYTLTVLSLLVIPTLANITGNLIRKIFRAIKRLSPSSVPYELMSGKIRGAVAGVDL